jgi:hypothetical protein
MTTKDVILAGAGFVVGYLLMGYFKNSKANATESQEPIVDQAKIDSCKEAVALQRQTIKMPSPEAVAQFEKEAFEACMKM